MRDGPHIARVAALIGDAARAEMLSALLAGQALTATELAQVAGVTKQTASAHLGRLVAARLVTLEAQGRHRYFRLADADVAGLLESLMGVAARSGAIRLRSSPREPALRKARVCYDHLAGEYGVRIFATLVERGHLARDRGAVSLTTAGGKFFGQFGIDPASLAHGRRPVCRACLDWSARTHHLAGALGAALLQRLFALDWARRQSDSRVVLFTAPGESSLGQAMGWDRLEAAKRAPGVRAGPAQP